MPPYLFAYGTLQPGLAPAEIRPAVEQLSLVGPGATAGTLYDQGDYPAAVFDAGGTVRGRVYALPPDPAVLAALDAYEGVPDLYVRLMVTVDLDDGRTVDCWAYQYNRTPGRRLPAGVYPEGPP